jgi:hypothetical protein
MMNWIGCRRKQLWPSEVLCQHLPRGTEENKKKDLRIDDAPADI